MDIVKARNGNGLTILWTVMAIAGGYFLVQHALPKLVVSQEIYTEYYWDRRYWLLAHVVSGLTALVLGPLQFMSQLRNRWRHIHRWTGRVYLTCTLIAAPTAIVLAYTAPVPQPLYAIGLYGVSAFWVLSGLLGWWHIRNKRAVHHRQWMVRNYTTTFFLRLVLCGPRQLHGTGLAGRRLGERDHLGGLIGDRSTTHGCGGRSQGSCKTKDRCRNWWRLTPTAARPRPVDSARLKRDYDRNSAHSTSTCGSRIKCLTPSNTPSAAGCRGR